MNIQQWRGELEVFDNTQILSENDESLLHAWMTGDKKLIFAIGRDCELKSEEIEGKMYYTIERTLFLTERSL